MYKYILYIKLCRSIEEVFRWIFILIKVECLFNMDINEIEL